MIGGIVMLPSSPVGRGTEMGSKLQLLKWWPPAYGLQHTQQSLSSA